jgi:hypothetical protein
MKILYLTFYFEPDLCAGSFRNTPIVKELSELLEDNDKIHVITTLPNRYISYKIDALEYQCYAKNLVVNRVHVPLHNSDLFGQIRTFAKYFYTTLRLAKKEKYDMVFASSSRLFTAFLGAYIAKSRNVPLYLDVRDIFKESIIDVLKKKYILFLLLPIISFIENYTFGYAKHINLVSEGFANYFSKYTNSKFSFFTNGIDEEFLNSKPTSVINNSVKTILYAGNLGEGQGLHIIVPKAAKLLGDKYKFRIIGDGGVKQKLIEKLEELKVNNVEILNPVNRAILIKYYEEADFLFVHLNDYPAFQRVLPSKIFEYGAFDKPIIAGVKGSAANFIREHVDNHILFAPGDSESMASKVIDYELKFMTRENFIKRFSRVNIVKEMVKSIVSLVPSKREHL